MTHAGLMSSRAVTGDVSKADGSVTATTTAATDRMKLNAHPRNVIPSTSSNAQRSIAFQPSGAVTEKKIAQMSPTRK